MNFTSRPKPETELSNLFPNYPRSLNPTNWLPHIKHLFSYTHTLTGTSNRPIYVTNHITQNSLFTNLTHQNIHDPTSTYQ